MLILITSCKKNLDLQQAIRQTWIRGTGLTAAEGDWEYLFIMGDPKLDEEYRIVDDVLYVREDDGYVGLPRKLFSAFKAILELGLASEGVLKLDDDCYLYPQQLNRFLKNGTGSDYAGWCKTGLGNPRKVRDIRRTVLATYYKKGLDRELFSKTRSTRQCLKGTEFEVSYTGSWFDGGRGYYLSHSALMAIIDYFEMDSRKIKEIYEDKCWADTLRAVGMTDWDLSGCHTPYGKAVSYAKLKDPKNPVKLSDCFVVTACTANQILEIHE